MAQNSADDAPIDVERAAVDATYRRAVLKRLAAQDEARAAAGSSESSGPSEAPVTRG